MVEKINIISSEQKLKRGDPNPKKKPSTKCREKIPLSGIDNEQTPAKDREKKSNKGKKKYPKTRVNGFFSHTTKAAGDDLLHHEKK